MTTTKKYLLKIKEWTLFALLIIFALLFMCNKRFRLSVTEGISLWFFTLVPALFPYLFISAVLSRLSVVKKIARFFSPITKKLFNVNGFCGYAFFISLFSGYPVGAKMVSELKNSGLISEEEAIRSSVLCSTSSPAFLISVVGGVMANSILIGVLLFICHLLSVIIVGFVFSFYKKNAPLLNPDFTDDSTSKSLSLLYDSVYSSVVSILVVGGLITVFYVLAEMLLYLNVLSPFITAFSFIFNSHSLGKGFLLGILECTRGLKFLFSNGVCFLSFPIACFLCSFGGLSVIFQSLAYLKTAKIKTAPFLVGKLVTAFVSFIIAIFISFLFFR